MISRFSRVLLALMAASSTLAPSAFAQDTSSGSDQTVAQALFDQARALMAKKDYAHACVLLEKSEALDPGGGTLLNLAGCYEGQGALARAYSTYQEALAKRIGRIGTIARRRHRAASKRSVRSFRASSSTFRSTRGIRRSSCRSTTR